MLKLKVTGMTCGHCEKAVEDALSGIEGVAKVIKVSRADEEVLIEGEPDARAVIDAIHEEGYEAEVA
ncbi:MAG: heavy metal-associated domain-containing protein [Arhodomonas sp.]|uniref:heavy-metal-associated domain-containing protein n=1 Tax=Arhodomonas sp. SL1 TaxID=3425691 RepID=UPI002AD9D43C|nr:heavy metal-associated domain-containing protein [Arhodomonas sp.]